MPPLRLLALLLLAPLAVFAETGRVPPASDLYSIGRDAAARGVPLLLLVSQQHCGYCELMKREVLRPMLLGGAAERVEIRELQTDLGAIVTDFDGRRIEASEFAFRYRVELTPTLLFLDQSGRELDERIVGLTTLEMLGWYVEAAIERSAMQLRSATGVLEPIAQIP